MLVIGVDIKEFVCT